MKFELIGWVWRPYFPVAVIAILVAIAVCLACFAYFRVFKSRPWANTCLLIIRILLIATLTLVLLGPSRVIETEKKISKGKLYIVADISESMLTNDVVGKSRLETLKKTWLSDSVLDALGQDFKVSAYTFAETARSAHSQQLAELQAEIGQSTNLVHSTGIILDQLPIGKANDCILLLSDGIDSSDSSVKSLGIKATAKQIPIHTVAFGSNSSVQDAAVVAIPMQEFIYPNETGTILAKIYHVGCSNRQSTLLVKQGNDTQRYPVYFRDKDVVELEIPIQHEASGQYQYEISLDQVDQEIELRNNLQNVFAMVQPQRMKVLILEGQPFWDTKFIAQSLRKDDRIELTQISQITSTKRDVIVTRKEDGGSNDVPQTREEWSKYDVVILGRKIENLIDEKSATALVEHLRETGGNLVFSRGRAYDSGVAQGNEIGTIFAEIEPVVWGDTVYNNRKINVTMSGRMTQWFMPTKMGLDVETALQRMPGFDNCREVIRVKANARVLAEHAVDSSSQLFEGDNEPEDAEPALVTSSTGAASIVTITGQGMWRWSLLSTDRKDLVGFYDAFWSNMIRWLVVGGDFQPGQQVSMKLNHSTIRVGDEMVVDVVMKHASPTGRDPTLEIKMPDGKTKSVGIQSLPGRNPRFRASIKIENDGVHELIMDAPGLSPDSISRKFNAYSLNVERLNTAARPVIMRMISDQSGGRHYTSTDCQKFLRELKLAKEAARVPPRTVYIWDQGWLMALVLIVAGAEWIFRRVTGLI